MGRRLRRFADRTPYHITQRGNHQQDVFDGDRDRHLFMHNVADVCGKYDIRVLGYCLMSNHVHLLFLPNCTNRFSTALKTLFHRHAVYMNKMRGKPGHLWQGRFHSVEFDEISVWSALRYVELNPVKAGLARTAEEFEWSSARAHSSFGDRFGIVDTALWRSRFDEPTWRIWLREATVFDAAIQERITEIEAW